MCEANLKKIIEVFNSSNKMDMLLQFMSCYAMKRVASNCSLDFKKHVSELLMRKFLNLHLKTNKTIGASQNVKVV